MPRLMTVTKSELDALVSKAVEKGRRLQQEEHARLMRAMCALNGDGPKYLKAYEEYSGVRKAFDESKHPRGGDGRFGSGAGETRSGAADSAPPATSGGDAPGDRALTHADPDARAEALAAHPEKPAPALAQRVRTFIQGRYDKLRVRYGDAGAKAILGATVLLLPAPIPGSSLLPVAVAEAVLAIRRAVGAQLAKAMPDLTDEQIQALARDLLHDLADEFPEEQPAEADGSATTAPREYELLAAAVDAALSAHDAGEDPQEAVDALLELADDPKRFEHVAGEPGTVEKAAAVPKGAGAVADALRQFDADALDGLRVEYHPDGPRYWIDQMDWHDGKAGKAVIAAAKKAAGVRVVLDHVAPPPGAPAVAVFNEGPKPPGEGWVDLLKAARPGLYKALPGEKPTAAVDLDGTLARYDGWKGADHFGEALEGARDFLADLARTHRILIFTTRTKDDDPTLMRGNAQNRHALAALVKGWLEQNGLPYDEVYTGQGKPIADVYVDDRAVAVPPNPTPADYAAALDAIRARTVLKAFDESLHPRDDHGRFVAASAIKAALKDPAKADKLRERVTKPEEREKLDRALSGETHHSMLGTAGEVREAVQASRTEAKRLAYKLRNLQHEATPADFAELIPHLPALSHKELSYLRTMLSQMGARFGGARRLEERRQRLLDWARDNAYHKIPEHGLFSAPRRAAIRAQEEARQAGAVAPAGEAMPESQAQSAEPAEPPAGEEIRPPNAQAGRLADLRADAERRLRLASVPLAGNRYADKTDAELGQAHRNLTRQVAAAKEVAKREGGDTPAGREAAASLEKFAPRLAEADAELKRRIEVARLKRRLEAVAESERTGKLTVTESEMRELLAGQKDAYREAGLRGRVPYSPEHFKTSDLTGAKVRRYVELPNGQLAHPDELILAQKRGRLAVVPDAEKPGDFATARVAERVGQLASEGTVHSREELPAPQPAADAQPEPTLEQLEGGPGPGARKRQAGDPDRGVAEMAAFGKERAATPPAGPGEAAPQPAPPAAPEPKPKRPRAPQTGPAAVWDAFAGATGSAKTYLGDALHNAGATDPEGRTSLPKDLSPDRLLDSLAGAYRQAMRAGDRDGAEAVASALKHVGGEVRGAPGDAVSVDGRHHEAPAGMAPGHPARVVVPPVVRSSDGANLRQGVVEPATKVGDSHSAGVDSPTTVGNNTPVPPGPHTGGDEMNARVPERGDAVTMGRTLWTVVGETTPAGHAEQYGVRRFNLYDPTARRSREAVLDTATGEWSWFDQSGGTGRSASSGRNRTRVNFRG